MDANAQGAHAGTGGSKGKAPDGLVDGGITPRDAGQLGRSGSGGGGGRASTRDAGAPDSSTVDAADGDVDSDASDVEAGTDASIVAMIRGCGVPAPALEPRSQRWLAFPGLRNPSDVQTAYLTLVGPNGPGAPHRLAVTANATSIGAWSDDGRFFALTEYATDPSSTYVYYSAAGRRVFRVPDDDADPQLIDTVSAANNEFEGWLPHSSRYFVTEPDRSLVLVDAANVGAAPFVLTRRPAAQRQASPSGHHVLIWYNDAPVTVELVDTTQTAAVAVPVLDASPTLIAWSPGGRRAAFCGSANNDLLVLDTENVSAGVNDLHVACANVAYPLSWLDDDELSWLDKGRVFHFVDLSASAPAVLAFGVQDMVGYPSPGGKCVAFTGYCEGSGQNGLCIRSTPPDPSFPAVLVARAQSYPRWSRGGSRLLLEPEYGGALWDVDLSGSSSSATLVTEGQGLRGVWSSQYGPAEPPTLIAYLGQTESFESRAYYWSPSASAQVGTSAVTTFTGLSGKWSPDGTSYVYSAGNDDTPVSQLPYQIQHLDGGTLGTCWSISGLVAPPILSESDLLWQP